MNAAQQQPEVQQDTNTQSPTTPNANDANDASKYYKNYTLKY
jgi:hypothetical protein